MSKQFVFSFPLRRKGQEHVTGDARVVASSWMEAGRKLWMHGVHNEWIIGDCRHCYFVPVEYIDSIGGDVMLTKP